MPSFIGLTRIPTLRASRQLPCQRNIHFERQFNCSLSTVDMSDYEDEMDVDDAPIKESVMFSSDNTNAKGKRSAANLPVEAEDSLPW